MTAVANDPTYALGLDELTHVERHALAEELKNVLRSAPSAGELARIGAALTAMGNALTAEAKEYVREVQGLGIGEKWSDCEVHFTHRSGSESQRVDSKKLREYFPPEKYTDLYTNVRTASTIVAALPVKYK